MNDGLLECETCNGDRYVDAPDDDEAFERLAEEDAFLYGGRLF